MEFPEKFENFEDFVFKTTIKTLVHGACFSLSEDYYSKHWLMDWESHKYSLCYADWVEN